MEAHSIPSLLMGVLGGFALFVYGLMILVDGLRTAAGPSFRSMILGATRSRFRGLFLGTVLGTAAHSSATTVMVVGLLSAGLLTLVQSIPIIFGANLGTTIAMQVFAFKLGDFGLVPIALGLFTILFSQGKVYKAAGRALIGFGLIFIGMETMSGSVAPFREDLRPILEHLSSDSWQTVLISLGAAAGFTAIVQSSGATIGILFAFGSAGIVTDLGQVYPMILGAHIGTCATALIGSIGATKEARRGAIAHLLFNLIGAGIGLAVMPLMLKVIPAITSDLHHQIANANTAVVILTVLPLLPLTGPFTWVVRFLTTWGKEPAPSISNLDPELLKEPEKVIEASIHELGRTSRIIMKSLELTGNLLNRNSSRTGATIKQNEKSIDEITRSMTRYLRQAALSDMTDRQAVMMQHINLCMTYLERIGDHIDNMYDLVVELHEQSGNIHVHAARQSVARILHATDYVMEAVIEALNGNELAFEDNGKKILAARKKYKSLSDAEQLDAVRKVASNELSPLAGFILSEFYNEMDRIVRHTKKIASLLRQPEFKPLDLTLDDEDDDDNGNGHEEPAIPSPG